MSDILASPAAGTARPGTTQGGLGGETTARVVDGAPELVRLATGDSLRGTVVGRDDHGHLLVRTRLGVLTLAVPRPLPVGTEVVLQVRSIGPQVILNLLPLNAAAPGGIGAQPAQAPLAPSGQAPQAPSGAAPPPLLPANPGELVQRDLVQRDLVQRGQLLRAVLHAGPPLPSLAGLPTAQPGTELLARVLALGIQSPAFAAAAGVPPGGVAAPPGGLPASPSVSVPGSAPGSAPSSAPGGTPGGSPGAAAVPAAPPAPAAPGGAAETGLRLAPQMPVGASGHSLAAALQGVTSEAAAKAVGSLAGNQATGAPSSAAGTVPAAAGTLRLTGLVTATANGGQPILHTPLGTLTLDTRAALPPGTSLALEIALPATTGASPGLAAAWPSLESLEETLFHNLPAGQAEAAARALPQVGPRLASGVLFFLAALNQGNVAGWLARAGAGGERGEPGGPGLAERLGREFAGLARSIETPAGEWRFVNLPLWSEEGLRELRCFFRHQQSGGGPGGDGDKATRFVLELELQRHGELQLDGLVRGRFFDLMLRSRRPLSAVVRGDLMALFEEANAIGGYSGRLAFQASPDWLQLLAARSATQPHEGFRV